MNSRGRGLRFRACYDVVILDRDLPGLHGDAICRLIAERGRVHRVAGIELDPLRRTVVRDGAPVDLSAKEFRVLEALMRAAPAPLSAEELLETVWDENADPFTNTVKVTVGRLRRKLGEPQVVETVPGAGYRVGGATPSP